MGSQLQVVFLNLCNMTKQESACLDDLAKQFKIYVEDDVKWKEKIEGQLKPILEERLDRQIVARYGMIAFKVAVTMLGVLVSVTLIARFFFDFYKK